jgi:hypothetical protein
VSGLRGFTAVGVEGRPEAHAAGKGLLRCVLQQLGVRRRANRTRRLSVRLGCAIPAARLRCRGASLSFVIQVSSDLRGIRPTPACGNYEYMLFIPRAEFPLRQA